MLAPDGRLLVTDFHTGPLRPPKGWLWRAFAVGAELLAWHLNRSWAFLRAGGVPAMAARHGLDVKQARWSLPATSAFTCCAGPPPDGHRSQRTDVTGYAWVCTLCPRPPG